MIDPVLFAAPVALDRVQHRAQRLNAPTVRFDRTAGMNALFIAAVEFIDAARDYPIVFIEAGKECGLPEVDFRQGIALGVGFFPLNARGRTRQSSSRSGVSANMAAVERTELMVDSKSCSA